MIHIVNRGETVALIASRYGVSEERIISDNGLDNIVNPPVGMALEILVPQTIHRVRAGESVNSIAAQYGITPIELLQKNPTLISQSSLVAGQYLTISLKNQQSDNVIFNGYAYPFINRYILGVALLFMSELSVFSYGFTENGELVIPDDEPLLRLSRRFNVAPILVLSSINEDGNFSEERASNLFNNTGLQNTVITALIDVMIQKGYYGIDIDFEFISPRDKDAFVSFLRNITARMHANGFTVNVDLAPKISSNQRGLLYETHDYRLIGEIADTVLIMTYEWGYTYGPPLSVSPLPNVRQVIEYAVSEIPSRKIMLGISNYGYDWTLPFEQGISRADSLGNEEAIRLAYENGAVIMFDEKSQAPYFEYFDADERKHIVWFEDVRSISARLELIGEYNLRGAGYWNLMRAFAQNYAYISGNFSIPKTEI